MTGPWPSVGRRSVDGHEEERPAAGILHVVAGVGGNHDEDPRRRLVLSVADADERLALDDVDDLIPVVLLLGSGLRARGDGHDGRLASRGLLEDPEKPPAVGEGVDDFHQRVSAVAAARSALTAAPGSAALQIAAPASRTPGRAGAGAL